MTPEMIAYTKRHLAEVGQKIEAMLPILPDHWGPVEVGWLCAEIFDREAEKAVVAAIEATKEGGEQECQTE